jgi:hypothetical protein
LPVLTTRISCIAAAALCCSAAQAQIGVSSLPMPGPALVTCTNIELGRQVPCPDSTMFFHQGAGLVQRAFNARDFKALDELYGEWCTGKDRFPDGRWKLSQYGDGLSQNFDAWRTWAKDLGVLQQWQRARPQSKAALYAEAIYWRANAWAARGGGYAGSVSKEAWELFHERLIKSKEIVLRMQGDGFGCAAPYALAISLLTDLGAPEEEMAAVYREGVQRYPEYHNIYFAMARHHEPKWGGSTEEYEAFADAVAEQTRGFEGMGMYARLYWLVDHRRDIPFRSEEAAPPYWKKLRSGYEDLMRLYPSSLHNLGKYAGVACRSNDGELYRMLRAKITGYEQQADMLDPIDVCDRRHKFQGMGQR